MKRRIFLYFITAQIVIIIGIVFRFTQNKPVSVNVLGISQIEPGLIQELPNFYEPIPNSRLITDLSWMGSEYKYSILYSINSSGFNQKNDLKLKKEKNIFRIATIGDSFTFGVNVNTEENYPSQLQNLLTTRCKQKFEVINLGVGGYDFQYAVERFKLKGMKFGVDLALWLVIADDFNRLNRLTALRSEYYHQQLLASMEGRRVLVKDPYIYLTQAQQAILSELGKDEILKEQKHYLEELSTFYKKPLVFFTFSGRVEYNQKKLLNDFVNSRLQSYYYKNISDIHSKNGVLGDFHPNKIGHKIIAEDVFNYLKKSNLISCD